MANQAEPAQQPSEQAGLETDGSPQDKTRIDLHALAEEVLALLKRDLRLERERQGRSGLW